MQEPYKDMYLHLYKHVEVLEKVLKKLSEKIGDSLLDSTNIYLAHFDEQARDNEDIKKQFASLFENL